MTLLTPLGLLGLIGIIVLIIIYIIKPNYQQKFISSTYIWKLSLKYRKKRIPTSQLRNLLLILCQVLLLTAFALVLAQPNQVLRTRIREPEVIVIIDSSASMRTELDGETRFERAVEKAAKLATDTLDKNGFVSVILADESPAFLQQRISVADRLVLEEQWDALLMEDMECSYASSDIDGAVDICEEVIKVNPDVKIYLYTDKQYANVPKAITLENVSIPEEWNAAILDAYTQYEDNYYTFFVEVASYGHDLRLDVALNLYGVNARDNTEQGEQYTFTKTNIECTGDEPVKLIFVNQEFYEANQEIYDMAYGDNLFIISNDKRVHAYQSIHVSLLQTQTDTLLQDSFIRDNSFDIYGGMKQVIKIQYASEKPNSFWPAALRQLRLVTEDHWDIQITEVKKGEEPSLKGFDFYIFEHEMPMLLPEDGVVWLVNPDFVLPNFGIRLGANASIGSSVALETTDEHPVLNHINPENITVSAFKQMVLDGSYQTLLSLEQFPMLAVRNEDNLKIAVMAFSLHFSNLPVLLEFPFLVYNMFTYFFPTTVTSNSFEVNETVVLNARGNELTVKETAEKFTEFPTEIVLQEPGTYTLQQKTFTGDLVTERIFVRIPKAESNIWADGETIIEPYVYIDKGDFLRDLLLYLAIGIVALLFIEWWLRGHEAM